MPEISEWREKIKDVASDMDKVVAYTDTVDNDHEKLVVWAIDEFDAAIAAIENPLAGGEPPSSVPPEPLTLVEPKEMKDEA